MSVINEELSSKRAPHFPLRGGLGISAGCFAGAGYGLAVGLGRVVFSTSSMSVVVPSTQPFAHDGSLAGAFCGVAVGAGFGNMIAAGFGYRIDGFLFRPFRALHRLLANRFRRRPS